MIKQLSYKARFYLLVGSIPILLLLCWNLAFSQTANSYADLRKLKSSIEQYTHPDQTIAQLQDHLSLVQDNALFDPNEVDESLMDAVSRNIDHYKIKLEEFPETHFFQSNNYLVQTYKLTFSGRFINLLGFIHFAEYEINPCKIVSVSFYRKELRRTGEKLFVEIYFQSIYRNP